MSISIPYKNVDKDMKKSILSFCNIKGKKDIYTPIPKTLNCFRVDKQTKNIVVPMGLWRNYFEKFPNKPNKRSKLVKKLEFKGDLYTIETDPKGKRDQQTVAKEALKKLKKERSVYLALHTGFGKTREAIYLSTKITRRKKKILVLSHISDLGEQWKESYEELTNASVKLLKSSDHFLTGDYDVYICGVIKASNMAQNDSTVFQDVGCVIIDEAHIVTEKCFSDTLLYIQPEYLIACSATPNRPDGMHKLFVPYFGKNKTYIKRHETKKMTVFKYETPYEPEIEYVTFQGKTVVNWTKVINSLAYNSKRNRFIVRLLRQYKDENIIVSCSRVAQINKIVELCKKKKISVSKYCGTMKRADKTTRVLVCGKKKAGVGFDDPNKTMMIMACNSKNIVQLEGRIRKDDCIIIDLIDDYRTLHTHWLNKNGKKGKRVWFEKRGADIFDMIYNPQTKTYEEKKVDKKVGDAGRKRFLKPNLE